jgi:hypothetical protein
VSFGAADPIGLTLRGDAKYSWGRGSLKREQEVWVSL